MQLWLWLWLWLGRGRVRGGEVVGGARWRAGAAACVAACVAPCSMFPMVSASWSIGRVASHGTTKRLAVGASSSAAALSPAGSGVTSTIVASTVSVSLGLSSRRGGWGVGGVRKGGGEAA